MKNYIFASSRWLYQKLAGYKRHLTICLFLVVSPPLVARGRRGAEGGGDEGGDQEGGQGGHGHGRLGPHPHRAS